jgi:hypothetical protein
MLEGSCHCGGVKLRAPWAPKTLLDCNCSVCRRLGALWGYFTVDEVVIEGETATYAWGDRKLFFHHCPTCGCTTHWSPTEGNGERMGINFRLMAPEDIAGIRVRPFDGASTWRFLDED